MPTYEFTCKQCGNRFEVMVASSKKSSIQCAKCQSTDLQEIYSVNVGSSKGKSSSCAQSDTCPSKRFGFG